MRLRELFEQAQDEVAVIFGRFNPPHQGHRAAWELMSQKNNWYVGTNPNTKGPKDPLPIDVKIEAMKVVYPEIENHLMITQSWLTMASDVYKKYPDSKLLVFTDEDWVTKTINQYNGIKDKPHGFYDFTSIEQRPTPRLSSATELRSAVSIGDRESFSKAAGIDADTEILGQSYFDLVSKYLPDIKEKTR